MTMWLTLGRYSESANAEGNQLVDRGGFHAHIVAEKDRMEVRRLHRADHERHVHRIAGRQLARLDGLRNEAAYQFDVGLLHDRDIGGVLDAERQTEMRKGGVPAAAAIVGAYGGGNDSRDRGLEPFERAVDLGDLRAHRI